MQLICWNVNSIRARMPGVEFLLENHQPDVLALQETKVSDDQFPEEHLASFGYKSLYVGQPSYNGVAFISKSPLNQVSLELTETLSKQKRVIAASFSDTLIINAYIPMGESLTSEKYTYKLSFLEDFCKLVEAQKKQFKHVLLCGDFNIAPQDIDVYDPEKWQNQVLVSEPERALWKALLSLGFKDVYRTLDPDSSGFTWWDYRRFAYRRKAGLRIDHWLCTNDLFSQVKSCQVLEEVRQQERPSDHAPLALNLL